MSEFISVQRDGHVATVTIESRAMPPAFFTALGDAFRELSVDDTLRAVVLRSSQKGFSYGLDLAATMAEHGAVFVGPTLAKERTALRRLIRRWQDDISAIAACPVPVIAAVHGWCIGGGVDVIAACDIRVASEDAKFSVRETKVAIVADLGSLQRLPAIIGAGHTRQLAFTGGDIDAARARAIGLVNDVYADREAAHAAADAMAHEIAANAPLVVRGVKHVLDACADRSVQDGLEYVATYNAAYLASHDLAEAAQSFMTGQPPRFQGH